MWRDVANSTGAFFFPQLVLSVIVTAQVIAYLTALGRGELRGRHDRPWRRVLDPLGALAVSVGLLGSVYSFARAFAGFGGEVNIDEITARLGTAYGTTAFGLVTSIIAGLGSYVLGVVVGRPPEGMPVVVESEG